MNTFKSFIGCMQYRIFLIVLFLVQSFVYIHAQIGSDIKPKEEWFGVKQGLSQGMINCIYQDKVGFIWISTKDGLNRYDGYKTIVFRHDSSDPYSLPDNFCNATIEDEKGNFWVATNTKGLFLFDRKTEKFIPISIVNAHQENLCIRELNYENGKLFLNAYANALIIDISKVDINLNEASTNQIQIVFNYSHFQKNNQINPYSSNMHRCSWLPGHKLWFSFADSILIIIPNESYSKWSTKAYSNQALGIKLPLSHRIHFFAVPNEKDQVIFAFHHHIWFFDLKSQQFIFKKILTYSPAKFINNYFQINNNNICSVLGSSLTIFNPATKQTEQFSLPNKVLIISYFVDNHDVHWLGSNGYGIIKKDPKKNAFNADLNFLRNVLAQQPTKERQAIYDQLKPSFFSPEIKSKDIFGKLKFSKNFYLHYQDSFGNKWKYYQDANGENYIESEQNAANEKSVSYKIPNCIDSPDSYVSQLYLDHKGTMWLATIGGLYALDTKSKSWKHWKNDPSNVESLSSNILLSLCPDPISPEKFLWIGTEGSGFNRFEMATGSCIRYSAKQGLPNDVAYSILSDNQNNLWISTNNGLSCFNPMEKSFRNFTEDDGLPGNEFNRYEAIKMPTGELLFGGMDGFVLFNPNEILKKQASAEIIFTEVTISNKPIDWKSHKENLHGPIAYTNELTLQPGQNIFSVSCATLEYRSNAKKLYRYKLGGFETDWTNPTTKNEVTYTNLSPGTYTLYVMGANTDGVWNDKPISMIINVLPYWYQAWWFRLMMFLLVAGSTYAFYRYRLQQGLKIEKLRGRIARDLHDEIGSSLSSISLYSASAKLVTKGNAKAEQILEKINANTTEMMEAMSDIVWAVNAGNDSIEDLANRLRTFAVMVTEAKNINLIFTDNHDIPNVLLNMEQRKNIYLICKEAISNAVKYSCCTLLSVGISAHNKHLHITISDNGQGFVINDESSNSLGHSMGGNGLKNMRSRAKEIGASLTINSILNSGTQISISMLI
jgi:streptogramin lyase/two-component sensor histidine kinase